MKSLYDKDEIMWLYERSKEVEHRKRFRKEGIKDVIELQKKLKAANRVEDMEKALDDEEYLDQLFNEFGLAVSEPTVEYTP